MVITNVCSSNANQYNMLNAYDDQKCGEHLMTLFIYKAQRLTSSFTII